MGRKFCGRKIVWEQNCAGRKWSINYVFFFEQALVHLFLGVVGFVGFKLPLKPDHRRNNMEWFGILNLHAYTMTVTLGMLLSHPSGLKAW